MRTQFLLFVLALFVGVWATADAQPTRRATRRDNADADFSAPVYRNAQFITKVVELTNQERAKLNIAPVKLQAELCKSADYMAADMAVNNYFEHKDRSGRHIDTRLPEFGYKNYSALGENIAGGQLTPAEVVASWMKSPGHRANLLNPDFREIGVGYVHAPNSELHDYWVQDFGSRSDIYPLIINMDSLQTKSPEVVLYVHGDKWAQKARFSSDGQTWTDWETYQPARKWTLPAAAGKQSVFVEISNGQEVRRSVAAIEMITPSKAVLGADRSGVVVKK